MGGCRCSYRTCTVRSDGKTHMFHYPVMDKVRCHQWLTNARRLDFLNLTVSQLKNRVVCQHHFTDENFMNYMKDKLRFDAVPTEDGPFCDLTKNENEKADLDFNKTPLITIEDIENEVILRRNLVNLAMKYGDFLTTSDLMETLVINNNNKIPLTLNEYDPMHTNNDVKIHIPLADTKRLINSVPPMIINKELKPNQLIKVENLSLINKPSTIDNEEIHQTNVIKPCLVNKPVINRDKEESGIKFLHKNHTQRKSSQQIKVENLSLINKPTIFDNGELITIHQTDVPKPSLAIKPVINKHKEESGIKSFHKNQTQQKPSQQIKVENLSLINKPTIFDNGELITIHQTDVTKPSLAIKPVMNKHKEQSEIIQTFHTNNQEITEVINANEMNRPKNNLQSKNNTNHRKIRILSEKKILKPLFVKGKLEPVPPSLDLSQFSKKKENKSEDTSGANNYKISHTDKEATKFKLDNTKVGHINSSSPMVEKQYTKASKIEQQQNINNNTLKLENEQPKAAQVFKFKMPAERYAAIQEKRKFNMKLKDIIENGLNKLEKQEQSNNNTIIPMCNSNQKDASNKVGSFLSKEAELPSITNYTIACLEARMKRMENLLFNKIDQNSQRIVDLKNSMQVDKKKTESIATQTPLSEEAHKKCLFQEISKYLSPNASSLIFEELFIDRYANSVTQSASGPKRRKFR